MKISFNIRYRTNWGESVYLTGEIPALGSWDESRALKLNFDDNEGWDIDVELPANTPAFQYRYIIRHENGYTKREWGEPHVLRPAMGIKIYEVFDRWQDQPWDKPFYSKAFTGCECLREHRDEPLQLRAGNVNINVQAPMIHPDEAVAICGSCEALGAWDGKRALVMNDADYPVWSINIPLKELSIPFEYKFIIVKKESKEVVAWENVPNRTFDVVPASANECVVYSGMRLANPLTPWKGAGVAIPVFSLRTEEDFGAGDFYDLKKMVDWAVATGQKVIQILPINDTTMTGTWTDSYPYNANSTFALHPMYLRLEAMGELPSQERRDFYDNVRRELNALETVDYERVNNLKIQYTHELFDAVGAKTVKSADFKAFVDRNKEWLTPYAAFCVLRDINHTPVMQRWGVYAEYEPEKIARFVEQHKDEINFVYFQQYHLDKQMRQVVDYAHKNGVAIKGDIPIGISRTSVDAWINPRLFNLDCQAGAPPDDFSVQGQNWGFPTYNWEEMNLDGFAWWRARFSKMAEYFDAYRIDHVLGFFRIWQIPYDALHGLLGVFSPALPFTPDELRNAYDFWIDVDLQTNPYIMEYFLHDFFGEYTDEARERFLTDAGYGRYRLKEEFNTQRKVAEYFATQEPNDKNNKLCNALQGLIDDVLFIEDPYEKGKYHPRISAQFTYIYRSLTDYEKWCFDRLYNDFFYRRHNDFWYGKAMWKLPPLINSNDMLVCAEDLGMIPDCVPAVLSALEVLTLEIQRMPKDPKAEFGNTWSYPYYSVCTTSTHDMGGIRQWWEEDRGVTQRYYNNVLHEGGPAPFYAEPWVCDKIVTNHLLSPSMLCILPLQDWLSLHGTLRREDPTEEQINVPANPRHYWRYRMHLTIDRLIGDIDFCRYLRDKVRASGR